MVNEIKKLEDRIMRPTANGCWLWKYGRQASVRSKRNQPIPEGEYGHIRLNGVNYRAHRAVYLALVGDIPNGMFVCHHCDTPACVNPDHLFLGNAKDNVADMHKKGRQGPRKMPRPKNRGSGNGNSHFTADEVTEMRSMRQKCEKLQTIASRFHCSISTVSRITHYQTHWDAVPEMRMPLSPA